MAYDEAVAASLRARLAGREPLTERKMFGGPCFLLAGNMVCGAYRDRAMFRVGKAAAPQALGLPGVSPMAMAGRPMRGFVEAEAGALADPAVLDALVSLALDNVATLPPK
jgi:TfoX/Sxy family transcriptional regulator of competence genes